MSFGYPTRFVWRPRTLDIQGKKQFEGVGGAKSLGLLSDY